MKNMRTILITLLFFTSLSALAQKIAEDRIEWRVTGLRDLSTSVESSYSCKFITGPGTLRWEQKESVTVLEVTGTEGRWPNISQDGKTTYLASDAGEKMRLTFQRQNGQVVILMEMIETQKQYRFTVSQTRIF